MKILVITNNTRPDSGWGRYSQAVINEYPSLGVESRVLTEQDEILPATSVVNFIKNCFAIRRMAGDYDIVHAFDAWPYGVYAWIATFGTKKKYFINAIGTYSVTPLHDFFKGFLLKRVYKNAKAVFAISNFIKEKILKYINLDNIHTVYLAHSKFSHISQAEIDIYKERFGISDGSPIILTVGEVKDRKGQYEVVESIKILKNKYPDILYIMVGSDRKNIGYINKINEYIKKESLDKNVRIISDVNTDAELAYFYGISDVFILNAKIDGKHFEGFGDFSFREHIHLHIQLIAKRGDKRLSILAHEHDRR